MKFSLIICTYHRPDSLLRLLYSVKEQSLYPEQILIIDGSLNNSTELQLGEKNFANTEYCRVEEKDRGLTRQRNFGLTKLRSEIEIVCFLDDDCFLSPHYFEELIGSYRNFPEAVGVSGYITNENKWREIHNEYIPASGDFVFDNWVRTEGRRFSLRRKFGLEPDLPPGYMPSFSHGYSSGFLPPSGKTYEVEMLMGGIASYKTELLKEMNFSEFFEGYGLYEDADFSMRASWKGKLYVNTAAGVEHHHEPEGRPNRFTYGKMVVRNGWYVWRVKYPTPPFKAKLKWHGTSLLLTLVRLGNTFTENDRKAAFSEALGRFWGWGSLFLKNPSER